MVLSVIFIIYLIVILLQLGYYSVFLIPFLSKKKHPKFLGNSPAVSVIIAAKNEAKNLNENLPFIAKQIYPKFEIILINDHSKDATLEIMYAFKKRNPNLNIHILSLTEGNSNKKKALTKGIAIAKYNNLLFTDADCKPSSDKWITAMSNKLQVNKKIVLGYGAYENTPNSWLNKLIRFETVLTAMQYFSYAKIGLPYMAVGRNLLYKKELFNANHGFDLHKHIKSGDDDLFINQVATNKNTTNCFEKEAHTISKAHTSFKKWVHQKKRHVTTANHYKPIHQFLLGLFYLSNLLFWILSITLILFYPNKICVLVLFGLRIFVQYLVIGIASKKLNEKKISIFTPFLELFLILIQLYIFITNSISKPKTW